MCFRITIARRFVGDNDFKVVLQAVDGGCAYAATGGESSNNK